MPSDNRPFITVAVDMDRNPKYAALNDAQKFLIIRAWLHCAEFLTDGLVSMPVWRKMGTDRNRKAILESGACSATVEQNGVVFHDYLEHQQSRADVMDRKQKARSSGQLGGHAKAANAKRGAAKPASDPLAHATNFPSESVPDLDIEEENYRYVPDLSYVSDARESAEALDEPSETEDHVEALCLRLRDQVHANGLVADPPVIDRGWQNAARALIQMDGREPQKAVNLIDWCQQDDFWKTVVHDMASFRRNYKKIHAKATAEWQAKKSQTATGTPRADQKLRDTVERGARLSQLAAAQAAHETQMSAIAAQDGFFPPVLELQAEEIDTPDNPEHQTA